MSEEHIPIHRWGRDHWSTFGYVGARVTGNDGIPDQDHMRCDNDRHPGLAHRNRGLGTMSSKHPTRLVGEETQSDHDDWDCVYDMEKAGLVKDTGTGINPIWNLTEIGWAILKELTAHKQSGGSFENFKPKHAVIK